MIILENQFNFERNMTLTAGIMKKYLKITVFLFFIIFLVHNTAQSQAIKDIETLKSELDTISAQQLPINSIALTPDSNWVILYGDIGYSYTNLPPKIVEKLSLLNKEEKVLNDIDFYGASKVILYEDNAFYSDSLPETLSTALSMLNKNGRKITGMNYAPNGAWIILYNQNSYFQNNIPGSCRKKIENLAYRDQIIKQVAFCDKAWVVFYSFAGYSYSGIPEKAAKQIDKLYKENHELNKIFFLANHWVIVYDSYKYVSDF